MAYPYPPTPLPPSPQPPTTAMPPPYPAPPPSIYGYGRPAGPANPLLSIGGVFTILGGLIVGIGWLLPTDNFWIAIGIGWLMFGPGIGLSLLGLGKQYAYR